MHSNRIYIVDTRHRSDHFNKDANKYTKFDAIFFHPDMVHRRIIYVHVQT